jgi:CRP/FNR family transcriptional regulator
VHRTVKAFAQRKESAAAKINALPEEIRASEEEEARLREIVSRLLRNFEDRGWVDLGRERVRIVDRDALASLARG